MLLRRNRGAIVARLSRADLEEVYSLRLALERLAVVLAARHGTEADFATLDDVLHEFRGTDSSQPLTEQEAADQDVRFHDAIYRAAHHERLYVAWSAFVRRSTSCCWGATSPARTFARTPTSAISSWRT